jgi:FMN reductase
MTTNLQVTLIVGNPRSNSRTLAAAVLLGRKLAAWAGVVGAAADVETIDLTTVAGSLFDLTSTDLEPLLKRTVSSELVATISPTYKATYTGLLKAFLDRLPSGGLTGRVGLPIMTGGSLAHSLAPDTYLRPLLIALGASVPTAGLFLTEADYTDLDLALDTWLSGQAAVLGRALGLSKGQVT